MSSPISLSLCFPVLSSPCLSKKVKKAQKNSTHLAAFWWHGKSGKFLDYQPIALFFFFSFVTNNVWFLSPALHVPLSSFSQNTTPPVEELLLMYFPFSMFALLVRFRSVQPNAADEGADHPCDDDGEANPPGVHFFSLKKPRTMSSAQKLYIYKH